MAKAVDPVTAGREYKQAIDKAVTERDIEFLVHLIRTPPGYQEVRDHLADVIEDLLSKRKSFPNRKPKQDLEEKRKALADRVWKVKKQKGWKLRSVVHFVAGETPCSESTVWSAWRDFGPVLLATDFLRERYDIDALVDTIMAPGREGGKPGEAEVSFGKLSHEQMSIVERLVKESLEIQDGLHRQKNAMPTASCKKVRT